MKHHLHDAQGEGNLKVVRQLLRTKKHQTITRDMVFEKGVESIQDSVHVVRIMFKESKSAERDRRGRRRIEPGEGGAKRNVQE